MEVEVKIRLDDASAHQKVVALLTAHYQVTHLQQNVFFDGAQQELSSKNMVLRLRFYNGDERCVVSLKGKAVIIDGISRGSEVIALFLLLLLNIHAIRRNPSLRLSVCEFELLAHSPGGRSNGDCSCWNQFAQRGNMFP